jgi:hypothetical protein
MRKIVLPIVGLAASSCVAAIQVGGFRLDKAYWERDQAQIRSRASFDLHCSADQIELVPLSTYSHTDWYANTVGVKACGQQVVYLRPDLGRGTWVLNSERKN